jgi:Predicted transcriptional regulators
MYLSMSETQTVTDTPGIARELSAFQQNILTILAEEARYGLAIKRELESYYESEVNHGRLYPNLDDLVEMGLVEKSELDKRTNEYALTQDGYQALLDQLEWQAGRIITSDDRASDLESVIKTAQ